MENLSIYNSCNSTNNEVILPSNKPSSCKEMEVYYNKTNYVNTHKEYEAKYELETSAFYKCVGLRHMVVPNGVTKIGYYCFGRCVNLEDIILPPTLREICYEAFVGCTKLKSIVIPEGVEILDDCCFADCENLEEIWLPSTIKKMGSSIFSGCNKLKNIRYYDTSINSTTQDSTNELNNFQNNSNLLKYDNSQKETNADVTMTDRPVKNDNYVSNKTTKASLPEGIKVKFLGQVHKTSDPTVLSAPNFEEIKEQVAYSQLNCVQEMIKRPDCLVFPEAITEEDKKAILENKLGKKEVIEAFRTTGQYLTKQQIDVLWKYGAVAVAYFVDAVKGENIYPIMTAEDFQEKIYEPIIGHGVEIKEKLLSYGVTDKWFIKALAIPKEDFPTRKPNSLEECIEQNKIKMEYFHLAIKLTDLKSELLQSLNPQLLEELNSIINDVNYLKEGKREEILRNRVFEETSKPENEGKNVIITYGIGHKKQIEDMFKDNLWE